MTHGLQLVLWYRNVQGHIRLTERGYKLLPQITFSKCDYVAKTLSKDIILCQLRSTVIQVKPEINTALFISVKLLLMVYRMSSTSRSS